MAVGLIYGPDVYKSYDLQNPLDHKYSGKNYVGNNAYDWGETLDEATVTAKAKKKPVLLYVLIAVVVAAIIFFLIKKSKKANGK